MLILGKWLNSIQEWPRTLTLIPVDKALVNKDLFLVYLDAMGALRQWEAMKTLLTQNHVPLEASYLDTYLFRCSLELGDVREAELFWSSAQVAASHSPRQMLDLASYAEKSGDKPRAASIYRLLTPDRMVGRSAFLGLLRVSKNDAGTLRDLLDAMAQRWPDDASVANDDVYYNLLLNTRVSEMYRRALELSQSDPQSMPHLTDLALAYLRLNGAAHAMNVYANSHIQPATASPSTLVVYAATLHANGRDNEAHQILSSLNLTALRPEEAALVQSIP